MPIISFKSRRGKPFCAGAIAAVALTLTSSVGIGFLYVRARQAIMNEVREELERTARIAAAFVDGKLHQTFTSPSQIGSADHQRALEPLICLHRSDPDIAYVYTVILRPDGVHFILDTTTSAAELHLDHPVQPSAIMDLYSDPDPEMLEALKTGKPGSMKAPRKDEFGVFMSGYSPILVDGRSVGVVGVDISAATIDAYLSRLRRDSLFSEGIMVFCSLLFGMTVTLFRTRTQDFKRRQAEMLEEVARSGERYRQLFVNLTVAFAHHEMIYDEAGNPLDYRFLEVNPAFERLTGLSAEALLGRTVKSVLPGTEEEFIQMYGKVASTGEPMACVRYAAELGKWFDIWAFSPVRGQFAVIFSDITERRRTEEHLRQVQKMEIVGQLAGGVAHDFNNILCAILMQIDSLRDDTSLSDESRDMLAEMESSTIRAANLTRQLLVFSRRETALPATLAFNEVVAGTLGMLGRLIGEHIALVHRPSAEPVFVYGDAGMMEQVTMNLCVNARDAMLSGGTLTVYTTRVTLTDRDTEQGSNRRPGTFVVLSVADTGCGMDPEVLPRIFEPFFTTKEVGRGTGLGLATVYGIVQQHGGWIEVESAPGEGSVFRVYLPECAAPAAVVTPGMPTLNACGCETILLVEDDFALRLVTAAGLRKLGYTVLEAGDARDAQALWKRRERDIDLVFTDSVMPGGISGSQLVERLREETPGLKAIVATGYSADLAKGGAVSQPGTLYLSKPYDMATLSSALRELLDSTAESTQGQRPDHIVG